MKKDTPEKFRARLPGSVQESNSSYGMNGVFIFSSKGINLFCLVSDDGGWEHVSVSIRSKNNRLIKRCPTWEEMCIVKDLFWDEAEAVCQFHPQKKDYINKHEYCLHLWKMKDRNFELPPRAFV